MSQFAPRLHVVPEPPQGIIGTASRQESRTRPASMSEKIWFLKRCNLFGKLTPSQQHRLEQRARPVAVARRASAGWGGPSR